jgi:protein TonB
MNHQEGRVIVRIVIEEDGRITSVAIAKSSGHDVLDQAALDTLRRASPVTLSRPLDTSPLTVQIPLNYRLGQ